MSRSLAQGHRDPASVDAAIDRLFPSGAVAEARATIEAWSGYAPTPLVELPALATELGIEAIRIKDETGRFGLGSFKALGGAHAVHRILADLVEAREGRALRADELAGGRHAASGETVIAATAGNHGRSVAWGAERFGCRCVILVHAGVELARRAAIARFGAEIREVPGTYDDSVREAERLAASNGWHLVPDTGAQPDARVPALVVQGYTVMGAEIVDQWTGAPPTHVVVQVGVGGLATGVAEAVWRRWGEAVPRFVCVEPATADCLRRSIEAGRATPVPGDLATEMVCLACGEVSAGAWVVLSPLVTDVATISDAENREAMRRLAVPSGGDPALAVGTSGATGIALLIAAAHDAGLAARLGLDRHSRILAIASEGPFEQEPA